MARVYIGTSGWNYPHWKGIFYTKDLKESDWLKYYSQFFNCVEINVTFYRLVKEKTFKTWYADTPEKFGFTVKGSRYITHIKRLKGVEKPLEVFLKSIVPLKEKLIALLWQFPPNYKANILELEIFLKMLKLTGIRQVFEFRNDNCFNKDIFALLKKFRACLCLADSSRYRLENQDLTDFYYLRLHGRGSLYKTNYSIQALREYVRLIKKSKKDSFVFFNNDFNGFAVKNALRFKKLLK